MLSVVACFQYGKNDLILSKICFSLLCICASVVSLTCNYSISPGHRVGDHLIKGKAQSVLIVTVESPASGYASISTML